MHSTYVEKVVVVFCNMMLKHMFSIITCMGFVLAIVCMDMDYFFIIGNMSFMLWM